MYLIQIWAATGLLLATSIAGALAASSDTCCTVVELRQYTIVPHKLDDFVNLFDRRFIESQEAAGIRVIGEFRVIGDPDKFYWVRGFSSMAERAQSLGAFYYGPVWKQYRGIANPMLVENNNILLLRPAHTGSGLSLERYVRPPIGSVDDRGGLVVANIYYLGPNSGDKFSSTFEKTIRPVVESSGAHVLATFITEHAPNNFPILPIRDDANVFVWLGCFSSGDAYAHYEAALQSDPRWGEIRSDFALAGMYIPPEVDRLLPTDRSLLRCAQ